MNTQKQAKYLIDDVKFHIAGIATSWDYDNRAYSDAGDVFPNTLHDRKSGIGIKFKRDFQPQTDGFFRLEMFFLTELSADGVKIAVLSSDNEVLFEISTKDGFFFFNGIKTSAESVLGDVRLRADFDLGSQNAVFSVQGKNAGTFALERTKDISKIHIGTTGETEIKLTPVKNRLCADFLANESFMSTDSAFPETIKTDGDFEIRKHTGALVQMNYTYAAVKAKKGVESSAYIPLKNHSGDIIAEAYILLPDGSDGAGVSLMSGETEAFGVKTKDCGFYTSSGDFLRRFTPNVWQVIRFETYGGKIAVKIDGKKCGEFDFENAPTNGIQVYILPDKDTEMCFSDIVCESRIDYDDYCPEPKAVRHPEYEVGVNVCNMWREGHHFGWDRITYFTDNTPLIGPYDEGLPEAADWEIKFMTEHGITFQHFCWYCPDPVINFPIKRSRMDNALRDGFMNARYSDKMKFIIMWENNSYQNTNPDDFINYVWKYWCEYFFTDERYLKIDNKPLLSLWSFNFVKHWGGEEKAKEIIAFMNEDIKNYGCDGIILMATAGMSKYENLSEYCDVTYSYHFGKDGYSEKHQLSEIDSLCSMEKKGFAPYIKTVSVGFNSCPWHGADARVPLISLDSYENVLRYTKNISDTAAEKKWYDKIFMMSTWNEYGEGTYIMPSNLHGFGYLDRIRRVFAPESGKCENLLPDENQQKRITYLRQPGRVMARRLGFEKSDEFKDPNTLVKTYDFSQPVSEWTAFGETSEVSYTGTSLRIVPKNVSEHYSLVLSSGENGLFGAEYATHMKVYLRSPDGDSAIRTAFLTDSDKRWSGTKCERTYRVEKSDEFIELDFAPGKFKTWNGVISDLRIDNMNSVPFEISKIELYVYRETGEKVPEIFVNGHKTSFAFDPKRADGDFIVSLDPGYGHFRALKLYHEYRASSHSLLVSSDKTEAVFCENSSVCEVSGRKISLTEPMRMRDGLPTLKLLELCGIFGYRYTIDENRVNIEV